MHAVARAQAVPLYAAADVVTRDGALKGRACGAVRKLLDGFAAWREMLGREGHLLTVSVMLDESGYVEMWRQDKSPEAPGRLENLKELMQALREFETLSGFLDHVSLVMENEQEGDTDKLSMMTLHGAKGLEFDTVFLPGWEEGLFPSQRSMDENGTKGLEEERRLAYVGITRARRRAVISHVANRQLYGNWQASMPSRFLEELPEEHVERAGSAAMAREQRLLAPTVFTGQFPLAARRPRR